MSAPDKIYLNILDDGRWMNFPQKAPCAQEALMDGETVETYHHDRVVLDLRRRLEGLEAALRTIVDGVAVPGMDHIFLAIGEARDVLRGHSLPEGKP